MNYQKQLLLLKKTGSEMLDQLSTSVRPNKKYKTDRKDLDGGAIDVQNLLIKNGFQNFI